MAEQLPLPFESGITPHPQLLSPREIWARLSPEFLSRLKEDRRIEFKSAISINFEDIAQYYSAFSNTPEGGILVFGIENKGAQKPKKPESDKK